MGNARYVGRVGALAVALGVGVALANAPGVALAGPADSGSNSTDDASSASPPVDSSPADPSSVPDTPPPGAADTSGSQAESDSTPKPADTSAPAMNVDASGGANTSIDDDDEPASGPAAGDVEPAPELSAPGEEPDIAEPAPVVDPISTVPEPSSPEDVDPQPTTEPVTETPKPGEDNVEAPLTDTSGEYRAAAGLAAEAEVQRHVFSGTQAVENQLATFGAVGDPGGTSFARTASIQEQAAPSAFSGPLTPLTFISTVVSSVLSLLLGPVSAPTAPTDQPLFVGLLEWVRRQFNAFVFNKRPVVTYDSAENEPGVDGVVAGDQIAEDPEGDPLHYTVTRNPENGTVEIHTDGTFTYTPDVDFAQTGGTDTFEVRITDTGFHLPGLISRLTGGDYSTSAIIEVPVGPLNAPPVVGTPPFNRSDPDLSTGLVTGSLNVTDPDGDDLEYSKFHEPTEGELTLDEDTGKFIYKPTQAARDHAASTPDVTEYDNFSIDVTDGTYVRTVEVSVPIAPDRAPVLTVTPVGMTDVSTGAATYRITVTDPDAGDTAQFAITEAPGKGALRLNSNGTYTYAPTAEARLKAAATNATPADKQDTFTVTATDGALTTVEVVTVSVTAPHHVVIATIPVGDGPGGGVVSPDGLHFFVANPENDTISVVDTATNTVVASINGGDHGNEVAFNRDATRAYVSNSNVGTVTVYDTVDYHVVTTIGVGVTPWGVTLNPDGTRLYVANFGSDQVSVIDTASNTVVNTIEGVPDPLYVVFRPDGKYAYVTNFDSDTVTVIDTLEYTIEDTIDVNDQPTGLAVSRDGAYVYVSNFGSANVSVIETDGNTVITTVNVGGGPADVAVGVDGTVYVVNGDSDTVSVIDSTNTVTSSIFVGDAPLDMVLSPDGTHLYISNNRADTVSVISIVPGTPTPVAAAEHSITGTLPAGSAPFGSAVTPDGSHLYVANSGSGTVSAIDVETGTAVTIPTGNSPWDVAMGRDGRFAYVTNRDDDNVAVIDTASNTVVTHINVGDAPEGLAVNPDGSRLYVAVKGSDLVAVIDTDRNTVIGTISGIDATYIAFTPDGANAYVTSFDFGTVSVVDTSEYTVVDTITVGVGLVGVAMNGDGSRAYVANVLTDTVSVIDTASRNVLATINVGGGPRDVTLSPDGTRVYVSNFRTDTVSVIDSSNTVVDTLFVGDAPQDVAVGPDGTVYAVNAGSGTISVISVTPTSTTPVVPQTDSVTAIGIGGTPFGSAISPDGTELYIADNANDAMLVIDTGTRQMVGWVPVGDSPWDVAVRPDGQFAYVTNRDDDNITVVNLITRQFITNVAVGDGPEGMAVSPDGLGCTLRARAAA